MLKSVYGSYLTVNGSLLTCATAIEMDPERSVWNLQIASSLPLPSWLFERPSFAKFSKNIEEPYPKRTLRANPVEIQEMLIVEDLLDIMLGY